MLPVNSHDMVALSIATTMTDLEALGFCSKPFGGHLVVAGGAEPKGLLLSDGVLMSAVRNMWEVPGVALRWHPGLGPASRPAPRSSKRHHSCVRSRRWQRATPMKSGHRKSDRPSFTPMRAVRPVSEGPQMPTRQVVKTNGQADAIAASWVRWGGVFSREAFSAALFLPRRGRVGLEPLNPLRTPPGRGQIACAITLGAPVGKSQ